MKKSFLLYLGIIRGIWISLNNYCIHPTVLEFNFFLQLEENNDNWKTENYNVCQYNLYTHIIFCLYSGYVWMNKKLDRIGTLNKGVSFVRDDSKIVTTNITITKDAAWKHGILIWVIMLWVKMTVADRTLFIFYHRCRLRFIRFTHQINTQYLYLELHFIITI